MSHRDDEPGLIEQASRGDTAAFGHLVRRYRASVHAYIMSRIGDRYRLTQRGRRAWRIERLLEGAAANG